MSITSSKVEQCDVVGTTPLTLDFPSLHLTMPSPLRAMPEQIGSTLPAPHVSEVISSLENCEWALTRARETITSLVTALKQQPRQDPMAVVKEVVRGEVASIVKTEPGSDIESVPIRVCCFQLLLA